MKNKIRFIITTLILVSMLIVSACGNNNDNAGNNNANGGNGGSDDKVYKLRIGAAMNKDVPQMASLDIFMDAIGEASNGRIEVEFVGGPEAIPAANHGDAIKNGTIDMSWTPLGNYTSIVPEAIVFNATELTYEEEIEKGAIEFLSKFHEEKMNAKLIGRASIGQNAFFTKNKIETMEDFKGMKLRGHSIYAPLTDYMGASLINLPAAEIYSALDKGLVDGFGWAEYGMLDLGVQKLINYKVQPSFNRMDIMIIMNLDSWNKLPADLQQVIVDTAIMSHQEQAKVVEEYIAYEEAELKKAGVEVITMKDAEEFKQMAREQTWKWVAEKVDNVEQFKPYLTK